MQREWTWPFAAAVLFMFVAPATAEFPDGPGKEILEKQCSTCHLPDVVLTHHKTADEWKELVGTMIDEGAEISDEQVPVLVEYLARNWGKAEQKPAEKSAPPIVRPMTIHSLNPAR